MWALRILTGSHAGQVYPLKSGRNVIGRGTGCDIKLNSEVLSREHASIYVTDDKVIASDLNSRNGTFVNGVKVQNQKLQLGDKMMFLDLIVDLIQIPDQFAKHIKDHQPLFPGQAGSVLPPAPAWLGNAAVNIQHPPQQTTMTHSPPSHDAVAQAPVYGQSSVHQFQDMVQAYIDQVAMPGIYHFAQSMPFFQFVGLSILALIVAISSFAIVPVLSATKSSILLESKRRALTIARNLAQVNRQAVLDRNELALNIRAAQLEEGVNTVMIVSAEDGTILAPLSERGKVPRDGFVSKARRDQKETEEISRSTIKVAVPILFFNEKISSQSIAAFTIIHYDTAAATLSSVDGLVLFVKIFTVALLLGFVLFFILKKIIEQPLKVLNSDLDEALRLGKEEIRARFQIPSLEVLVNNINTTLSRSSPQNAPGQIQVGVVFNRDIEATNIIRMLTVPALAINAIDNRIISTNEGFNHLASGGVQLTGKSLLDIPDPALQENLNELLPRMKAQISEIALSEIPFFGERFEICGQVVMGATEPAWFLITLNKLEGEG